jgi:hypothetical protein
MNWKRREKKRLWCVLRLHAKIYFERLKEFDLEIFDRGRNSRKDSGMNFERYYLSTAMMPGRMKEWLNC